MTLRLLLLAFALLSAAHARTYFVVASGLGGTPEYDKQFAELTDQLKAVLENTAGANGTVKTLRGRGATKSALTAALKQLAAEAKKDDSVAVFLLGHGTWDGRNYKFNVSGPDITDDELAELLKSVPAGRRVLLALTSASGELSKSLKGDGLVVITATRSGGERNIVRFPRHYIEALTAGEADTDKSETVSAEEAFLFAQDRVKSFYADANMMQSEHAVLTGDGAGTFVLARSGLAAAAASDPRLAPQISKKEQLEQQIQELRGRRAELGDEQYFSQLEKLLTDLANLQTEIEEKASPK